MPIEILPDDRGFFDRECPCEECLFTFKILLEDWENKVNADHVFCPRCGFCAPADQWWTQDQLNALNDNILSFTKGLIHDELAKSFKRYHGKKSIITYKPARRPQYLNLPITQSEGWVTEIVCDACGVLFSVIGNAYFCPCCGKDLSTSAIGIALDSYEKRLNSFDELWLFFEKEYSKEEAERQIALFREDMLDSLVGTFESFAKNQYLELGGKPQRGNVFLRITDGSDLYKALVGVEYRNYIGDDGVSQLTLLVNKRHLIVHNNGIVDESYIRKAPEDTYSLGQRIVLKDDDLSVLLMLIRKLAQGLMNISNYDNG